MNKAVETIPDIFQFIANTRRTDSCLANQTKNMTCGVLRFDLSSLQRCPNKSVSMHCLTCDVALAAHRWETPTASPMKLHISKHPPTHSTDEKRTHSALKNETMPHTPTVVLRVGSNNLWERKGNAFTKCPFNSPAKSAKTHHGNWLTKKWAATKPWTLLLGFGAKQVTMNSRFKTQQKWTLRFPGWQHGCRIFTNPS